MSADGAKGRPSAKRTTLLGKEEIMVTKRHRKKIARELPPVGTTLNGRLRGETYTAVVACMSSA
jgi:hypothetical protein